jgi:hypothetical protein
VTNFQLLDPRCLYGTNYSIARKQSSQRFDPDDAFLQFFKLKRATLKIPVETLYPIQ